MARQFQVYKGLQRPLVYRGFKGKFIYWGIGALLAGLVMGALTMALVNMWLGMIVLIAGIAGGLVYIAKKQCKGLHVKLIPGAYSSINPTSKNSIVMAAKQVFNIPYIGVDHFANTDILVGSGGECSVIIKITNPVTRFSAATATYDEFHALINNIVKVMGDGYLLQKSDILSKEKYPLKESSEYLQQKYNSHFAGREYLKITTYITLTRQVRKGALYVFDKKALRDFIQQLDKVMDILIASKTEPAILKEKAINLLVMQFLAMDFSTDHIVLNNLAPNDTEIRMGERSIRSIPLII